MIEHDKLVERARFDARAKSIMDGAATFTSAPLGSQTMASYLQSPYIFYEKNITELIRPSHRVLELGAGAGLHTRVLLQTGAQVTASDISSNSLSLLMQRFQKGHENLTTKVADMESLPFDASSFDVITSAGSLSYGEPQVVDAEIRRVLRPGGTLICVDSLNHNPIYRVNRWVHYLRGNRSKSTLKRMPDLARIKALGVGFSRSEVHFFGAVSFAMPIFSRFVGEKAAQTFSDQFDHFVSAKRSAFKFVLVAQGLG